MARIPKSHSTKSTIERIGMKTSCMIALVLFLLPLSTVSAGSTSGWDRDTLLSWVGKYPAEVKGGNKTGLLNQPAIGNALHVLLQASDWQTLAGYDEEDQIEQKGDFLVINKCKPHDCPAAFAMIVIDVNKPRIWVGLFRREKNRVSTRWYGNADDYSALPGDIRQEFLSNLGN